ncbi:MAG: outer membrane beta-barrel protein [Prevotellaceae bacterium]|jgi:hypothetical protein|nr:outer membrane beta-barrel protein [Prevotellaceae bacterium]
MRAHFPKGLLRRPAFRSSVVFICRTANAIRTVALCVAACGGAVVASGSGASGGGGAGREAAKIAGTVYDAATERAMEHVTVVLLDHRQKTMDATLTDAAGAFTLVDIPAGRYVLKLSFLGYADRRIDVAMASDGGDVRVPPIAMAVESKRLDEVVVAVEKSMIEHHIDKIVINVADYIGTEGGNVVDMLRKIAGITVDSDGNVSLNGQPAAIYLDNRPSNLSKMDLLNMLYFIEAAEIDKVELIQNPSAKFDASGGSAIINIITKKNTLNGWSGSVQASGGAFVDTTGLFNGAGGATVHYRNKWFNTSLHGGLRSDRQATGYEATTTMGDVRQYQHRYGEYTNAGQTARMTTNFFAGEKDVIGFILSGGWNHTSGGTGEIASRTDHFVADRLLQRTGNSDRSNNRLTTYSANANYQHTFKKDRHDLLVNVDAMRYSTQPWSYNETRFINMTDATDVPPPRIWQHTLRQKVETRSAMIDYERPIGKRITVEAGGKLAETSTTNSLLYEQWELAGWQRDDGLSNDFRYRERIGAIYVSVGATLGKKWQLKRGLRWENTWSRGDWQLAPGRDTATARRYNNLFSTIYVGYNQSLEQSWSLSYAQRIQRPDYAALNPFRSFSNYYSYSEGNPHLLPQYIHTIHANFRREKWNVGGYLQLATQVITENIRTDTTIYAGYPVTARTWSNFGQTSLAGISLSGTNLFPVDWWSYNLHLSGLYIASTSNDQYRNNGWFATAYMENTFYIGRTWRAELTGNVQSPLPYGYYRVDGNYTVSAGLRKTLWNHAATLTLYIDDMFDSRRSHILVDRDGQRMEIRNTWSSRQVRLSFSYRFRQAIRSREGVGRLDERDRL